MAEISEIEIPNRALFKASEVCDLLKVQPYVLRTWEAEFRDLGVPKGNSGTRVYRREDIARVQRIKHLLLIEGLTLAGVRRKLEEEAEPPLEAMEVPGVATPVAVAPDLKSRITDVKRGLRSLLDLLDAPLTSAASNSDLEAGFTLAAPGEPTADARGTSRATAHDSEKPASPRRKRSA